MAFLLLLDTSGSESTAALARDGVPVALRSHAGGRDGAAVLNGLVAGVLEDAGTDFAALEGVSVLAGPGSYTGLRVAVAAAKGFCYALDLPLIGMNKLELLARQATDGQAGTVVAAMPARAGEWFVAAYAASGAPLLPPAHRLESDVLAWLQQAPQPLCWTGAPLPEGVDARVAVSNPDAVISVPAWSQLSEEAWAQEKFESLGAFSPFYLKAPFIAEKKHI